MELLRMIGAVILLIELVYFLFWVGFKSVFFLLCVAEKTTSLLIKIFPSARCLAIFGKKLKRILNTLSAESHRDKRDNPWEAGKILNFTHYRKKMRKLSSQHNLII